MRPVLLDSSVYIYALRIGDAELVSRRRLGADAPLWLSSVVLEELLAGAGQRERRVIEAWERDFEKVRRILVPNLSDWRRTGIMLARLAAKYGYEKVGQGKLTNDALIATSAGRLGILVLTFNEADFRRLSEFRDFEWQTLRI
jgi:predicted nucleic acid-binding protein